jgi:predicted MFS family arabinose efflux permease
MRESLDRFTRRDEAAHVTLSQRRTTYAEVFAEPIFRVLFLTRSVAIAADTLRILALSVLVFSATGSALLGAITFGIGFLPQVFGGALLGSMADRLPPRPLIAAGYLLECAVAAVLATADLPVAASLALVALIATLTPIFGGASSRIVAEVLTGDAYVLGRSLSNVASSGAQLLGLAAGGAAVAALGARHALLVSAACHLFSAVAVRLLLPRLPTPDRLGTSVLRQSWTTTTLLLRDRTVRSLLLIQWLPPAFVVGAEALIVPYVAERGFGPGSAGALLACIPAGMLIAHLVVGRMLLPSTRERLVVPLLILLGAPIAGLALSPSVAVAGTLLAACGAGFAYALGVQRAFLDALPEARRGHAFALLSTGLMTMQGFGPVVFGAVAQFASIAAAMVAAGAATVLTAAAWLRHSPR